MTQYLLNIVDRLKWDSTPLKNERPVPPTDLERIVNCGWNLVALEESFESLPELLAVAAHGTLHLTESEVAIEEACEQPGVP